MSKTRFFACHLKNKEKVAICQNPAHDFAPSPCPVLAIVALRHYQARHMAATTLFKEPIFWIFSDLLLEKSLEVAGVKPHACHTACAKCHTQ